MSGKINRYQPAGGGTAAGEDFWDSGPVSRRLTARSSGGAAGNSKAEPAIVELLCAKSPVDSDH